MLFFTAISNFVVGKKLGCLNDPVPPECNQFMEDMNAFLESTQKLMYGLPLHKLWRTKTWDAMVNSEGSKIAFTAKMVKEKISQINAAAEMTSTELGNDFLTYMIHSGRMDAEEIAVNAIDLISGGIDTVCLSTFTLAWEAI